MYTRGFTELFQRIASGNCQITLIELADRLEVDRAIGALGQIACVRQVLEEHNLRAIPGFDKGEIDTVRVLKFKENQASYIDDLKSDLLLEESPKLEFKTSLRLDVNRYNAQPEPKRLEECRSDEVLFAVLKTIAAFANTDGGRLYVGITDSKQIDGLRWDFLMQEMRDPDRWQLFFRDAVLGKCKDGGMVNEYVDVALFEAEKKLVARIDVNPRPVLTFVKKNGQHVLFRRQGNRTVQVDICEMEELLRARWGL